MSDRCHRPSFGMGLDYATSSLLAVAFLWGSYSVTLRLIYADPDHPSPTVLTALPAIVSASLLAAAAKLFPARASLRVDDSPVDNAESSLLPLGAEESETPVHERSKACLAFLHHRTQNIHLAGSELGLYVGLRTLCFTLGCTQVTAVTAAFLLQATNVITPCLAFLAGDRISRRVWLGTVVVALGTVLIFVDGLHTVEKAGERDSWLSSLGKVAILAAAFFNSLRTLRVSQVAPRFPVLSLAAGQSAMTALVTIAIAGRDIVQAFSEASSVSGWAGMLWPNWNNPYEAGLVLWAGLGPEAIAFLLQLYGQRKTAAATAQVIYASVPIWAAILSLLLLSERHFGSMGWTGACLVVTASIAMGMFR